MQVREIIDTYYPEYSWYGEYPADQCAPFNKASEKWGVLGNFGHTAITLDGVVFQNSEQLFHMMKFRSPEALHDIHSAKGLLIKRKAKKWERMGLCREDWPQMLVDALKFCLMQKYSQSELFRETLKESRGRYIVEDQSSFTKAADTYGAKLSGDGTSYSGPNLMGRLLMELRENGKLEYSLPGDITSFADLRKAV